MELKASNSNGTDGTRLTAATDLLSVQQNHTKGKAIILKDQLILTTKEICKAVTVIDKENEERKAKKQNHNHKKSGKHGAADTVEVDESDSETYSLPDGILECIEVTQHE